MQHCTPISATEILAGRNSSANPVKLTYRAAEFFMGCTKISINICILFIID